jgi:hypothetical protein
MSSMPHKSGVVIKLGVEPKFEFEEFPPYDDEGV